MEINQSDCEITVKLVLSSPKLSIQITIHIWSLFWKFPGIRGLLSSYQLVLFLGTTSVGLVQLFIVGKHFHLWRCKIMAFFMKFICQMAVIVVCLADVAFTGKVEFKGETEDNGIAKNYIATAGDCSSFKKNLPVGCTASFDCSEITCDAKFIEKDMILTFTINKCEVPVTVTARVQIADLDIDYSHTFSTSEKVGIPGFSYSVFALKIGVFLGIDLTPDDDDIMEMKVSLYVGGEAFGEKEYVSPLTILDEKIPISTDECGIVRWWKHLSLPLKLLVAGGSAVFVIILLIACCCCCCRKKSGGRVLLQTAPNPNVMVTTNSKVPMKPLAESF